MISLRRDIKPLQIENFMFTTPERVYLNSSSNLYNVKIGKLNDENTLTYEILAAGYEESDFDICQKKSELSIKAKVGIETKNVNYYSQHFKISNFNLSIQLLEYYVVTDVKYVAGILTITTVEKFQIQQNQKFLRLMNHNYFWNNVL